MSSAAVRAANDADGQPGLRQPYPLWLGVMLAVVLLGPRVARLAAPRVWLEDTPYLYSAFLITEGHRPYVDFPCPHFPTLEQCLALAFWVFGASYRVAEILTQLATLASSLLVYRLATHVSIRRRPGEPRLGLSTARFWGIVAAALFGACSLTFRFHLFEREVFLDALLLATMAVTLRDEHLPMRWAVGVGLALGVGMMVKLTFVIYAAILIVFVWWQLRQPRAACAMAGACGGLVAAATVVYGCIYGREFFFQVFAFHLLKGRDWRGPVERLMAARLWCSLPTIGLILSTAFIDRLRGRVVRLSWAVLGGYAFFLFVCSPTLWAHNLLMMLPCMAILGGAAAGKWWQSFVDFRRSWNARGRFIVGLAGVSVGLTVFAPLDNNNSRPEGLWGFGGMRRADIARAAAFIREHVGKDEPICAPAIVALEARRYDPFPYRELLGVYRWAKESVSRIGFREARLIGEFAPFFSLEEECRRYWQPQLFDAIGSRRLAAVVPATHLNHYAILLPAVIEPKLERSGYAQAFKAGPLSVWLSPEKQLQMRLQSGDTRRNFGHR